MVLIMNPILILAALFVAQADVDKVFERWNRPDSPGCAVAVIRDGKTIFENGYGMADLDHDVPITTRSVFHVASVSKQFTAAAIVLLAQQGKLSLDDPVRKHVPELPDFGRTIKIRHLIHHTSGIRDQWELLGLAGWRYSLDLITDEDVLEMLSRQKDLNFDPGERYLYCNSGYTLLAQIVKRVSGKSFSEFTREQIFLPLGMERSFFRDDHAVIVKDQALGYAPREKIFRLSITNFDTVGATSLLTTVQDLALWDKNFYDARVGGAAFVEQMLERGRLNSGEVLPYAFGLQIGKYRGLATVEHSGSDAGYRSNILRFPEQRFSVITLCNAGPVDTGALSRDVADLYLAQQYTEAAPAMGTPLQLTEPQLLPRLGLWWNRQTDVYREITLDKDKLQLQVDGTPLIAVGESRFQREAPLTDYDFESPTRLAVGRPGGKPDTYERVEPYSPGARLLAEYAGTYRSEEIENVYRIAVEDGALVLKRLKARPMKLKPALRDVFFGQLGTLRFSRDSQNRVSGVLLNGNRILGFRFRKDQ